MHPERKLAVLVACTTTLIVVLWVILFRNHALAPPIVMPNGPSLTEVSKKFTQTMEEFQAATHRDVQSAASDDTRTPAQ